MTHAPMLEVTGLNSFYGWAHILFDLSLTVGHGEVVVLPAGSQDLRKRDYVGELGADITVAVGNGRNDRLMLEKAALGIAVIQAEGAAAATLTCADVVCTNITSALDLLIHPLRLVASLRS